MPTKRTSAKLIGGELTGGGHHGADDLLGHWLAPEHEAKPSDVMPTASSFADAAAEDGTDAMRELEHMWARSTPSKTKTKPKTKRTKRSSAGWTKRKREKLLAALRAKPDYPIDMFRDTAGGGVFGGKGKRPIGRKKTRKRRKTHK